MTHIQEHFVPEENAEARKWTILKPALETASSAIRRRLAATSGEQSSTAPPCPPSLPACRDFSTWASNRDLWQWISKFRFLYILILKVLRAEVQIFSEEMVRSHCFDFKKQLLMMNPFLTVSDCSSIKGGAGDSLSPSCSRIENKFSTQSQF